MDGYILIPSQLGFFEALLVLGRNRKTSSFDDGPLLLFFAGLTDITSWWQYEY